MALEDDIRTLSETPLLDHLGRDALRLIAFSAGRRRLSKGETLFGEGDPADSAFVVVSGVLSLTRAGSTRTFGPATLIGELALLTPDAVRPATATATEPTEVLQIARGLFERLFDEYPDLARKLHARLSARLQDNLFDLRAVERLLRK